MILFRDQIQDSYTGSRSPALSKERRCRIRSGMTGRRKNVILSQAQNDGLTCSARAIGSFEGRVHAPGRRTMDGSSRSSRLTPLPSHLWFRSLQGRVHAPGRRTKYGSSRSLLSLFLSPPLESFTKNLGATRRNLSSRSYKDGSSGGNDKIQKPEDGQYTILRLVFTVETPALKTCKSRQFRYASNPFCIRS